MGINLVPTEISNIYNPILAEVFFAIIGLVFIATGIKAFRDSATAKHITTGIFWTIMGVCFIVGPVYSFVDRRCFDCCQRSYYRYRRRGADQK